MPSSEAIGRALRLAHRLSVASPALLGQTRLTVNDNVLDLTLPDSDIFPPDDRLTGPLKNLATATGRTAGKIIRKG